MRGAAEQHGGGLVFGAGAAGEQRGQRWGTAKRPELRKRNGGEQDGEVSEAAESPGSAESESCGGGQPSDRSYGRGMEESRTEKCLKRQSLPGARRARAAVGTAKRPELRKRNGGEQDGEVSEAAESPGSAESESCGGGEPNDWSCGRRREERRGEKHLKCQSLPAAPRVRAAWPAPCSSFLAASAEQRVAPGGDGRTVSPLDQRAQLREGVPRCRRGRGSVGGPRAPEQSSSRDWLGASPPLAPPPAPLAPPPAGPLAATRYCSPAFGSECGPSGAPSARGACAVRRSSMAAGWCSVPGRRGSREASGGGQPSDRSYGRGMEESRTEKCLKRQSLPGARRARAAVQESQTIGAAEEEGKREGERNI
ncbi:uncharacterized protein LOC142359241 [Opisthocomus hoazin]|uniref:uncharacterized protein LOC142359241 n=1 Tax=Opisthocomus hoazin TaxID=30419 RepID=UPI003F53889C